MDTSEIIKRLPYGEPFVFVDSLLEASEEGVTGHYTFRKQSVIYEGHFKKKAVIPGVLLTECCAQIGLVCLGIFLTAKEDARETAFALSSSEMEYLIHVLPGEQVKVRSEKIYFRFGKLKCKVWMWNAEDKLVCKGVLAGMQLKRGYE
ncbi:hydroxymyristoyl-ACP dehydratase [Zeaxanthinibacter sp. PT1]|uniref:3-hydroxyacyl-ACP dehydratase FabZ family protein n=1 Tax=Zeaxanthinibacter TaxID=561554 RepID=UPI002349DADF|nr:hydroxymyristoyl-ACP dehydratase [Zeaxanthinibacter sp. PT1]MDC6351469.1 hydroxymyristoyl-ACP dehydratase [Zeaxanthinibacter sp. PT1]